MTQAEARGPLRRENDWGEAWRLQEAGVDPFERRSAATLQAWNEASHLCPVAPAHASASEFGEELMRTESRSPQEYARECIRTVPKPVPGRFRDPLKSQNYGLWSAFDPRLPKSGVAGSSPAGDATPRRSRSRLLTACVINAMRHYAPMIRRFRCRDTERLFRR